VYPARFRKHLPPQDSPLASITQAGSRWSYSARSCRRAVAACSAQRCARAARGRRLPVSLTSFWATACRLNPSTRPTSPYDQPDPTALAIKADSRRESSIRSTRRFSSWARRLVTVTGYEPVVTKIWEAWFPSRHDPARLSL
jgi:hypothetical protein